MSRPDLRLPSTDFGLGKLTIQFHPSRSLKSSSSEHPFLLDLQEKSEMFDKAASKYSAKVPS